MITADQAREIASRWHSGGGSPLYAFSSTGAVSPDTVAEARNNLEIVYASAGYKWRAEDIKELTHLLDYLAATVKESA